MSWAHVEDRCYIARKRYTCELCGQAIERGWRYISRFGYDDVPLKSRMHVQCEALTRDWDIMDWECYTQVDGEWPTYDEHGHMIEGSRDG